MKAILIPFLSLLIPLTPQSAFAQSEPELKLESVVIVSRHGVRALACFGARHRIRLNIRCC